MSPTTATLVFHLDSDISLSTDPVIGFDFVPQDKGLMKVDVRDSENLTNSATVSRSPSMAS